MAASTMARHQLSQVTIAARLQLGQLMATTFSEELTGK